MGNGQWDTENRKWEFFWLIVDNIMRTIFFRVIIDILTFFIFYTPHFLHSAFSTLCIFFTPHFLKSAFFILLIATLRPHFPHFLRFAFSTLLNPRIPNPNGPLHGCLKQINFAWWQLNFLWDSFAYSSDGLISRKLTGRTFSLNPFPADLHELAWKPNVCLFRWKLSMKFHV